MNEFKTFPKPIHKEKVAKWGINRKYSKPKKFKKTPIPVVERPIWQGDMLLEPPFRGHYLYEVTDELAQQVIERSGGICENPECNNKAQEINHLCSHSRRSHIENLNYLCIDCHRTGKDAFHSFGKFYKYCMKKLQDYYFKAGYSREQVVFLLAKKDKRLF